MLCGEESGHETKRGKALVRNLEEHRRSHYEECLRWNRSDERAECDFVKKLAHHKRNFFGSFPSESDKRRLS